MSDLIRRSDAIRIAQEYGLNGLPTVRHSGVADIIADKLKALPAAEEVNIHDFEVAYDAD